MFEFERSEKFFEIESKSHKQSWSWPTLSPINISENVCRNLQNMFYALPWNMMTRYFLPTAEIKDENFMIDERNFFDQSLKSKKITYKNHSKDYTLVKKMIL